MNKLNKRFFRTVVDNSSLLSATLKLINDSIKTYGDIQIAGMYGSRNALNGKFNIQSYIRIKDDMHEDFGIIKDLSVYQKLDHGWMIRFFREKYGLIGLAYFKAAHSHDELIFPIWSDISISIIEMLGNIHSHLFSSSIKFGYMKQYFQLHPSTSLRYDMEACKDIYNSFWKALLFDTLYVCTYDGERYVSSGDCYTVSDDTSAYKVCKKILSDNLLI